jgi:hypothetical protein
MAMRALRGPCVLSGAHAGPVGGTHLGTAGSESRTASREFERWKFSSGRFVRREVKLLDVQSIRTPITSYF